MAGVVAYIDQHVQAGIESTIGTAVAADKQLQTLMFSFQDALGTQAVRPQGQRVDALSVLNTEYTVLGLTGEADYIESLVALEMLLGTVTPTVPVGGTTSHQRVYDVPLTGAITPSTRTLQYGDATYANQAAGAELVTLGCTYNRQKAPALTGSGFALAPLVGGTTFTASPTKYALHPIEGSHLNFYIDSTGAGLGGTQITEEVLDASWNIAGLRVPFWAADRSQLSYKKSVSSNAAALTVKLTLGESSVTRALISTLKSGNTQFLRISNQGAIIESTIHFLHQVDAAMQLTGISAYKNDGEVYAYDVDFTVVGDSTWGHAMQITSITDLATL